MPAKTEKQRRFMAMCEHDPSRSYKPCPSKKAASEFARKPRKKKRVLSRSEQIKYY